MALSHFMRRSPSKYSHSAALCDITMPIIKYSHLVALSDIIRSLTKNSHLVASSEILGYSHNIQNEVCAFTIILGILWKPVLFLSIGQWLQCLKFTNKSVRKQWSLYTYIYIFFFNLGWKVRCAAKCKEKKVSKSIYSSSYSTWLLKKCLTVARGPSSMLQFVQGFQFGMGGEYDTTPGVCLGGAGSNSSSDDWLRRDTVGNSGASSPSFPSALADSESVFCICWKKKKMTSQNCSHHIIL